MVVEEWGISHSGTAFIVAATANSPRGRERARLQVEACPSGTNFGAGACTTVTAAPWTDLGTDGRERLQLAVTGLTANVLYHWRARVLYARLTVTATGIIAPPAPEHGPWRRLHASHDNYDIRVTLPQTINVTMAGSTMSVGEAGPNAAVQVMVTTSNGAPTGPAASVDHATTNGSATAGSDYTTTTGTLLIPLGTASGTTLTVNVPITQDALDEPDETLTFTISNPSNATLVPPITTTVTIIDDDAGPNVTLSLTGDPMAEAAGASTVTATLSAISAQDVTVNLAFSGTATLTDDYTRSGTSIVITAGNLTGSITLTAVQDANAEGAESVIVDVVSVVNGIEATPQQVTATITDAAADLSIIKTIVTAPPYVVGQDVTYNIAVTNNGPDTAAGVTITDTLPAGTTFVSATPSQGSCSGTTTVTCTLGSLANTISATVALTMRLDTAGSISNTATASSEQGDPTPENSSTSPAILVAPAAVGDIPSLSVSFLILLASLLATIGLVRQRM